MATKQCTNCGETKPISEFPRRGSGYQSHCKECSRAYIRKHYQSNKQYYLDKNKRKLERILVLVREAKSKPCADCGQSYPYYVMDFDHRPGEKKVAEIARLVPTKSIRRIVEEIAKCDVVCANCHRKRTFQKNRNLPV
jgi:recombinational DNA repair protein (RecF pathway)